MKVTYLRICWTFLTLLIIRTIPLWAQDKPANSIAWKIAGYLPGSPSGSPNKGVAGPLTGVHGEVLIVAGGANFPDLTPWEGGKKVYHSSIYVFKKSGQDSLVWHKEPVQKLSAPLAYASCVSVTKGVVCVGGENERGPVDDAFIMSWDAARKKIVLIPLPSLPIALTAASITNIGSTVYVVGGNSVKGTSNQAFSMDVNAEKPVWSRLPDLPVPTSYAVAVSQSNGQNSCVYVIGGRRKKADGTTEVLSRNLRYDPKKNKWDTLTSIVVGGKPQTLSAATGVATGANYLLLIGGDDGTLFGRLENYDLRIAQAASIAEKETLQREKAQILMSHPGFRNQVLLYNTVTDVWTEYGKFPFAGRVTTQAIKWGNDIWIPSGEIRPGVRTPDIIKGNIEKQQFFSWIDSLVLFICFLLMTFGRYAFTGTSGTTNDYFKGGQRIPQWAAAVSIFGAKLSAITFIGIPAKTYATNWTYFFLQMTIVMIMPFVIRYFIPFYRRLNVTSAYEYLSNRFNQTTRLIASSLYIFLQLGRMGIVVLLPSIALTLVTGIDVNICILLIGAISIFFTVKGGIEAVIWVEVVQVLILASGALACLVFIPFQLNDWKSGMDALQQYDKLKVFDFRFTYSEPTFWVVLIGGLAIQLLTYGTDQTTVQRYLTTKTEKESINSLRIGAWLTVPSTVIFFSIGTLLFLFFREQPDQVNIALENQDNVFPWFIVSQLPVGLSGLLIAGIFAASMSSAEASMNSTATLLTTDFYKKWNPAAGEGDVLRFARLTTFFLGLFTIGIALYMAYAGVSSLWDTFNTVLGLFTGCIGGAFLLGIFTKKANSNGVVTGMIVSGITQVFIQRYTDIHLLLYAFTGLLTCVVMGYLFSWVFNQVSGPTTSDKLAG